MTAPSTSSSSSSSLVALALALAVVIGACTLFDADLPDTSCRSDLDCFVAQGEYCDVARNQCGPRPDAAPPDAEPADADLSDAADADAADADTTDADTTDAAMEMKGERP